MGGNYFPSKHTNSQVRHTHTPARSQAEPAAPPQCSPPGRWLVCSSQDRLGESSLARLSQEGLGYAWPGRHALSFIAFSCFSPGAQTSSSSESGFFCIPFSCSYCVLPSSNVSSLNSFIENEKVKTDHTNHDLVHLKPTSIKQNTDKGKTRTKLTPDII